MTSICIVIDRTSHRLAPLEERDRYVIETRTDALQAALVAVGFDSCPIHWGALAEAPEADRYLWFSESGRWRASDTGAGSDDRVGRSVIVDETRRLCPALERLRAMAGIDELAFKAWLGSEPEDDHVAMENIGCGLPEELRARLGAESTPMFSSASYTYAWIANEPLPAAIHRIATAAMTNTPE